MSTRLFLNVVEAAVKDGLGADGIADIDEQLEAAAPERARFAELADAGGDIEVM